MSGFVEVAPVTPSAGPMQGYARHCITSHRKMEGVSHLPSGRLTARPEPPPGAGAFATFRKAAELGRVPPNFYCGELIGKADSFEARTFQLENIK